MLRSYPTHSASRRWAKTYAPRLAIFLTGLLTILSCNRSSISPTSPDMSSSTDPAVTVLCTDCATANQLVSFNRNDNCGGTTHAFGDSIVFYAVVETLGSGSDGNLAVVTVGPNRALSSGEGASPKGHNGRYRLRLSFTISDSSQFTGPFSAPPWKVTQLTLLGTDGLSNTLINKKIACNMEFK